MKLFPEERHLVGELIDEWHSAIRAFQSRVDQIFDSKSVRYDAIMSPHWERTDFPFGELQEIRKKHSRLLQLLDELDPDDPSTYGLIDWKYVLGELADICNYSRMCGAIALMLLQRYNIEIGGGDK